VRQLRRFVIGAVAVATALALPADVARAAGGPPYTLATVDHGAGSNGGNSYVYSTVTQNPAGSTSFDLSDPVWGTGNIWVAPPAGSTLSVGSYVTRDIPDATHAGLAITQSSRTCGSSSGTLDVKEIIRDGGGNVVAFAAAYTGDCGVDDPLAGEIRFNSSLGIVGATETNHWLDYGDRALGTFAPQTLTITSVGSDPLVFGSATLGGMNPTAFAITQDSCSGQSIEAGASCSLVLSAQPNGPGNFTATLTVPENTKLGHRYATLIARPFVSSIGTYRFTGPFRVMDTRTGLGAPKAALGPGRVVHLQLLGSVQALPDSGVSAIVLNLTETGATAASFLTAYPSGTVKPTASNLNFTRGQTLSNAVTVPLGADGGINIYNNAGSVQVVVDLAGYYVGTETVMSGGRLHPILPTRILDTRQPSIGALKAQYQLFLPFTFGAEIDPHISALVVNITAVSPNHAGYLFAWDGTGPPYGVSTVNFAAGTTVPNLAIVPTGTCYSSECGVDVRAFMIYNGQGSGSTDVLVDVIGFIDDGTIVNGLTFRPVAPTRIVDSRIAQGIPAALGAKQSATVTPPGSLMDARTAALALNVTAVGPTTATYLTVWPTGARPTASMLNPVAHQTVAAAGIAMLSNLNQFNVFNFAGSTNVVMDVAGTYELYPYELAPSALSPVSVTALAPTVRRATG
jgi:hypothetical protein